MHIIFLALPTIGTCPICHWKLEHNQFAFAHSNTKTWTGEFYQGFRKIGKKCNMNVLNGCVGGGGLPRETRQSRCGLMVTRRYMPISIWCA
jgi:hypothetical protein